MVWRLAAAIAAVFIALLVLSRYIVGDGFGTATWDLSRTAGYASYVFLWAAIVSGMSVRMRLHPGLRHLGSIFEMHRTFSIIGLAYVIAHVVGILIDPYIAFSWVDGVLPFTSAYRPFAVGLGTIAMWLAVIVVITTTALPRLPRRTWWMFHMLSYPAYLLALFHGILAGTDSGADASIWLYALTASSVAFLTVFRCLAGPTVQQPTTLGRSRFEPEPAQECLIIGLATEKASD